jgi:cell division septation protein DedD
MHSNKVVVSVCCTLVLAMSGCSRQQSDWQKARETNSTDSYEQFLKKYPTGEFTAQAEARAKELYEERDWQKARDLDTPEAYQAFLKQYPEGKWTEEARIRVENFTLAQAPSGGGSAAAAGGAASGAPDSTATAPGMATVPDTAGAGAASPTPAKSTPPPRAAAAAPSGAYAVQLGAFKSGAMAAHERWAQLQKEYPSVLSGLSSTVLSKKTGSGSLYRLQATGLTEKHARAICGSLIAKSEACIVVAPAEG